MPDHCQHCWHIGHPESLCHIHLPELKPVQSRLPFSHPPTQKYVPKQPAVDVPSSSQQLPSLGETLVPPAQQIAPPDAPLSLALLPADAVQSFPPLNPQAGPSVTPPVPMVEPVMHPTPVVPSPPTASWLNPQHSPIIEDATG